MSSPSSPLDASWLSLLSFSLTLSRIYPISASIARVRRHFRQSAVGRSVGLSVTSKSFFLSAWIVRSQDRTPHHVLILPRINRKRQSIPTSRNESRLLRLILPNRLITIGFHAPKLSIRFISCDILRLYNTIHIAILLRIIDNLSRACLETRSDISFGLSVNFIWILHGQYHRYQQILWNISYHVKRYLTNAQNQQIWRSLSTFYNNPTLQRFIDIKWHMTQHRLTY